MRTVIRVRTRQFRPRLISSAGRSIALHRNASKPLLPLCSPAKSNGSWAGTAGSHLFKPSTNLGRFTSPSPNRMSSMRSISPLKGAGGSPTSGHSLSRPTLTQHGSGHNQDD